VLTVLSVAFPFAPVDQDPLGGAEQVLSAIDARLGAEGQRSIVLAAAGSRSVGHVVAIPARAGATIDHDAWVRAHDAYRGALAHLLGDHAIDVVHFHGPDFIDYVPETDVPIVATLHLPRAWYKPAALATAHVRRLCVSRAQHAMFAPDVEIAGVIENGVPLHRYTPATHKAEFALALGRICPEKGFEHAIRAAKLAGVPLAIAGPVFPHDAHERYAREVLAPLLDAQRCWIGAIAGDRKRRLLAEARCLLITSVVDETSSIVAMEALASGTPVVGIARGALPEIVEHGVTGQLVRDPGELPDAIARAASLDPRACRRAAEARFSAATMTGRHLVLYRALARPRRARGTAVEVAIATGDAQLAAIADEWDALCDRCPLATPLQRPGWLLAWRRAFGTGGDPRVAILRRGGRLVGIVPLELRGGVARLAGEGASDYLDAVVEPGVEPAVLVDAVRRAAAGARAIELAALRPCSPLLAVAGALGATLSPGVPSPVLAVAEARPPRRLAYERRRLAGADARWADERTGARALLDGLFALHRARWAERGERGVLDSPGLEAFHREAAAALHRRGLLRLVGLVLAGRLVAVLYGFADHGRFLFYLSGFAPEVARLSPGRLVVAHALERARDEGQFELDFLRGREPYKYEWGAVDRPASIARVILEEEPHAGDSLDDR
jgi:CelD/BcsL family acetyltransferase involved in cellulose biosynthesis/glycosyltransferase involved in cell wall biosynthesis